MDITFTKLWGLPTLEKSCQFSATITFTMTLLYVAVLMNSNTVDHVPREISRDAHRGRYNESKYPMQELWWKRGGWAYFRRGRINGALWYVCTVYVLVYFTEITLEQSHM